MDGVKLTDEEIVKALEICAKDGWCRECPYKLKNIDCGVGQRSENDYLDLIRRLRSEKSLAKRDAEVHKTIVDGQIKIIDEQKAEIEQLSKDYESVVEMNTLIQADHKLMSDKLIALEVETNNQQAEIKRLTEEINQRREMMSRMDCNYATELQKNAELQKQVDELKERNYWLQSEHEYQCEKSYFEGVEKGQEQDVKDTAREILQAVDKESNGQTLSITNVLRKRYGV